MTLVKVDQYLFLCMTQQGFKPPTHTHVCTAVCFSTPYYFLPLQSIGTEVMTQAHHMLFATDPPTSVDTSCENMVHCGWLFSTTRTSFIPLHKQLGSQSFSERFLWQILQQFYLCTTFIKLLYLLCISILCSFRFPLNIG